MKIRLDRLMVERGLAADRQQAEALIRSGRVLVDGHLSEKPGHAFSGDCQLDLLPGRRFVSRGGVKLEAGLRHFAIDPCGWICADIGCSTGGFTDCLLQHGAERVYSIDVGYGVLDWQLRNDDRVVVRERCNARYLQAKDIGESLDLAVFDVSFISLRKVLVPLLTFFSGAVRILALVKPQFELPRHKVGRGGIVQDRTLHKEVLDTLESDCVGLGLGWQGAIPSPITGAKGNQEFLIYLTGTTPSVVQEPKE